MIVITGNNNVHTMLKMYAAIASAPERVTRGQACRNLQNVGVELRASECPITSFSARKFNLDYAKKEWLWYLGADPKDDSIEAHATAWKKLKQKDGTFYSNYGQYIFGKKKDELSQFEYVIKTLKADPQSRRASIVLLNRSHLFEDNVDTVCTYAINFAIIGNVLDMNVMMRSNDVIFGFTNDAFCFWNLYILVYVILKKSMPELVTGSYNHMANSMHVYDRHYDMIKSIVNEGNSGYYKVLVPIPTADEAALLVTSNGKEGVGEYSSWLRSTQ